MTRAALLLALLLLAAPAHADGCTGLPTVSYGADLSGLRGGYCLDGVKIPGLVSWRTYETIPPLYFSTRALHQAPGLLEESAAEHGLTRDGVDGFIALLPPVTAGWKAFIQVPGGDWIPVRVADVVRRQDEWLEAVAMHSGLELSYALAQQLGGLTPPYLSGVKVCITDAHPEALCSGVAPDFTAWFESVLSWEK